MPKHNAEKETENVQSDDDDDEDDFYNLVIALRLILYSLLVLSVYIPVAVASNRLQPYFTYFHVHFGGDRCNAGQTRHHHQQKQQLNESQYKERELKMKSTQKSESIRFRFSNMFSFEISLRLAHCRRCRVHISIYFRFITKLLFKMETFPIEMAIIIFGIHFRGHCKVFLKCR